MWFDFTKCVKKCASGAESVYTCAGVGPSRGSTDVARARRRWGQLGSAATLGGAAPSIPRCPRVRHGALPRLTAGAAEEGSAEMLLIPRAPPMRRLP